MDRSAVGLIVSLFAFSLAGGSASAQSRTTESIEVVVSADPSDVIEVTAERGLESQRLNGPAPSFVFDRPSLTDEPQVYIFVARWPNGSTSEFPIVLSALFENKKISIKFFRVEKFESPAKAWDQCKLISGSSLEALQHRYFVCRAAAQQVSTVATQRFSVLRMRILSVWLRANYDLYMKGNNFSRPFWMADDLKVEIEELLRLYDEKTINRDDVHSAMKEAGTSISSIRMQYQTLIAAPIKMTDAVRQLTANKKYDRGLALNEFVTDQFAVVSDTLGKSTIDRVNRTLLRDNASFLMQRVAADRVENSSSVPDS